MFIHRFAFVAAVLVAACNPSPASAAPTTSSASASAVTSTRGSIQKGLRAEIVPVIGGLFPSSAADPNGKPVSISWTLRITNTTDAPIVLRTGGDDGSIEIAARGPGVATVKRNEPCPEYYAFGKKNVIPAKGTLDIPLNRLVSGARCNETSLYLTAPGLYAVDVTLNAHVHAPSTSPGNGDSVKLEATTINVRAS